ncbi:MAG TPA: ParB/RepB/Spo0J family partition protein [Rhodopila sp.]|nr:ParB/RepB/Spo0J family partition protein [Rhodopila sp.]
MQLKDVGSESRNELFKIDPALIQIEPGFNIRFDGPELAEANEQLKASIRENGLLKPLTVRIKDDVVYVTDGHRRLTAIKELISEGTEILSVKCLPEGKGVSEADRTLMLLTTNSGHPLSALEKAEVFKRLLGFGWSEEQVATKAGYSVKQVQNLLKLGEAPEELKEMVAAGEVSPTMAIKQIKQEGGEQAAETLKAAVETAKAEGKTKATEKTVNPKAKPPKPTPASLLALLGLNGHAAAEAEPEAEAEDDGSMKPSNGPAVRYSPKRWKEALETLYGILDTDDPKTIHCMVRDFLPKQN